MVLLIASGVIFLDRLTKVIILKNLALHQSVPVIRNIFHISLVYNRGAAFGILKDQTPFFIATTICAILLIFSSLKKDSHRRLYKVSLSLILGGAVGNLIDRLYFGYVVDFLDFRVWPVFNVADSAITVGALLLAWSVFRFKNTGDVKSKIQIPNDK